ncbi:Flp family type IVb pilin [Oryzomonas sagensis]|uniref:Flp family type IVb pilin n=1 Tax=Oryzomonas sagensis TaxID=2603857 RepID=A0ABQ6TKL5_9BACT|nr:Flp family type IVb pilin [Oryzomonas sagensis]KAB0668565.1 Flp family type IVb pilin [Oryzomonas sagensis]
MNTIKLFVINLLCRVKSEKGQTLVEYALIIVLIALAAIVAMQILGGSVNSTFTNAACKLVSP